MQHSFLPCYNYWGVSIVFHITAWAQVNEFICLKAQTGLKLDSVSVFFPLWGQWGWCRSNCVPVFDAAGADRARAEGWWAPDPGRPLASEVNTVCRLGPTRPPPAPLSLPALGCPPISQTGTDDRAMRSCVSKSCTLFFFSSCTITFCSRLTVSEPLPACSG